MFATLDKKVKLLGNSQSNYHNHLKQKNHAHALKT